MALTAEQRTFLEGTTPRYTCTIVDEDNEPIPDTDLTTLTVTIHDVATGTIINDREQQDALNDNGVTVNTDGELVFDMEADDMAIVSTTIAEGAIEEHCLLFEWTYNSGDKAGKHRVVLLVKSLDHVP